MAANQRHYSDGERAAALAVLASNDGNLTRTARETGIPRKTLASWAAAPDNAAPATIRQEKAFDLLALFRDELGEVFKAMGRRRGQAHYSDLSRAVGIYTDKMMALSNSMPTQQVDITTGGKPLDADPDVRTARILAIMAKVNMADDAND